jgi:acetone carboxylase gamma subunit
MTSYSKEVIRDLAAGQLPWPQTRRIMSAYKDDDRFFKMVAVYQDRVAWKDTILLPVSDHLFICQSGDERITRCECGHSFGDYRKNWKLNAAINVRNTEQWKSANSSARSAVPCTRSRRRRRAIRSCMISNPISKAFIANGWANHFDDTDLVRRIAGKVAWLPAPNCLETMPDDKPFRPQRDHHRRVFRNGLCHCHGTR